jgi:hypothetical protein
MNILIDDIPCYVTFDKDDLVTDVVIKETRGSFLSRVSEEDCGYIQRAIGGLVYGFSLVKSGPWIVAKGD